ncbi:unnamed protein product [Effrenium voratum]|nr:unnamed protein product [Effrenium voratum]|mmetsp:Transcript_126582/g.300674  ORF Transcript_126582/g.300674 Transcript_126582/m.300674 type:complete len:568 (+) Transcript_126582:44-1747(+)
MPGRLARCTLLLLAAQAHLALCQEDRQGHDPHPVQDVISTIYSHFINPEKDGKPAQRDVGIACMLLGSVAFVMLLFYVVNWRDDDIRLYAWTIISTTLSIFTAILAFSSVRVFCDMWMEAKDISSHFECGRGYVLFFLCFLALQLAAKLISGAYCDCCCPLNLDEETWVVADGIRADHGYAVEESQVRTRTGHRSIAWIEGVEVFVEKRKLNLERTSVNLNAWTSLLAHFCGFAAIEAGGALQHMDWFKESPIRALVAVLINQVSIGILFRGMDLCRIATINDQGDERVVLLNEEIKEAENDIISLASSFLVVQVIRFVLSGQLPDNEGHMEPYVPMGMTALGQLLACGVASVVLSVVLSCIPVNNSIIMWLLEKFQNITGMIFAWCTLWSVSMFVRETEVFQNVLDTQLYPNERHLVSALVLSLCSLMAIRVLDCIQDMGASFPRILQNMINVFSVLIGLSWEICFESGVSELSMETAHPTRMKLIFTICAVGIVLPAWRLYVVKRVYDLKCKAIERLEAKKKLESGFNPALQHVFNGSDHDQDSLISRQDEEPKPHRSSGIFGFW